MAGIAASGPSFCCGGVLFLSGYRCFDREEIVVESLVLVVPVGHVATFGAGSVVLVPLLLPVSGLNVVEVARGGVSVLSGFPSEFWSIGFSLLVLSCTAGVAMSVGVSAVDVSLVNVSGSSGWMTPRFTRGPVVVAVVVRA